MFTKYFFTKIVICDTKIDLKNFFEKFYRKVGLEDPPEKFLRSDTIEDQGSSNAGGGLIG